MGRIGWRGPKLRRPVAVGTQEADDPPAMAGERRQQLEHPASSAAGLARQGPATIVGEVVVADGHGIGVAEGRCRPPRPPSMLRCLAPRAAAGGRRPAASTAASCSRAAWRPTRRKRVGPVPLDAEPVVPPRRLGREGGGIGGQPQVDGAGRSTSERAGTATPSPGSTRCSSPAGPAPRPRARAPPAPLRPIRSPGWRCQARATTGWWGVEGRRVVVLAQQLGDLAEQAGPRRVPRPRRGRRGPDPPLEVEPQRARALGGPRRPPELAGGQAGRRVEAAMAERPEGGGEIEGTIEHQPHAAGPYPPRPRRPASGVPGCSAASATASVSNRPQIARRTLGRAGCGHGPSRRRRAPPGRHPHHAQPPGQAQRHDHRAGAAAAPRPRRRRRRPVVPGRRADRRGTRLLRRPRPARLRRGARHARASGAPRPASRCSATSPASSRTCARCPSR